LVYTTDTRNGGTAFGSYRVPKPVTPAMPVPKRDTKAASTAAAGAQRSADPHDHIALLDFDAAPPAPPGPQALSLH
jgi:hypothetical protein